MVNISPKLFVISHKSYTFVAKLQQICEMSNQKHKIKPAVKRYFLRLWAALCGRDLYNKEKKELEQRLDKATAELGKLKEMYATALDQWSNAQVMARDLDEQNTVLTHDLAEFRDSLSSCRRLVETLREHLREKDKQLDAYVKGAHI